MQSAIRAAADIGYQLLNLSEFDVAILAAIAYRHPITGIGLKNMGWRDPRVPLRRAM